MAKNMPQNLNSILSLTNNNNNNNNNLLPSQLTTFTV